MRRKQVICTSATSDINFLESKSKEHPYTPFISLHLKVVLISCNREIINCCGTCKFISPRIDCCTSARNYGWREMIFHTIADGLVFIINTPLFYFRLHLGIVMGINRDGRQGRKMKKPMRRWNSFHKGRHKITGQSPRRLGRKRIYIRTNFKSE